jgi:hypothetical protein
MTSHKKPPQMISATVWYKTCASDLLAGAVEHLHGSIHRLTRLTRLTGLSSGSTGLSRSFLRNEVSGHLAKLGSILSLAAAGAESYCRNYGENKSGEFHKKYMVG